MLWSACGYMAGSNSQLDFYLPIAQAPRWIVKHDSLWLRHTLVRASSAKGG